MELIENKLLLFGGKGGVGKTSCASATALYASSKGKKTLIVSTDPAHSLSDSFEIEIGNKITKINGNLDALEFDSSSLLKEYKEKNGDIIKQIANEGTFFSNEDIQEFFDLSLPGMDELMALIKIADILDENKYDLLIVDTAPTGHTIRLLEIPELMLSYERVLSAMRQKHRVVVKLMVRRYVKDKADEFIEKMEEDIRRIKSILKNPKITKFIPIMIPESMSILETEKFIEIIKSHEISIGEIIINNLIKENCNFCKSKKTEQEKYIKQIKDKFSKYNLVEIPLFPMEIKGKSLDILSKALFNEKYTYPKVKSNISNINFKYESLKINPEKELLLFGGKGGVGKTSCASATALKLSENKKVLIFSTDPAHSLSDSFDKNIGDSITKINENLDALEIDSNKLLIKFKQEYRKEIQNFFNSITKTRGTMKLDAPYDRRVLEYLFDLAPPGIDEIMSLKTVIEIMQKKKYDVFVLDTAPTGHAIRLLEMPEIAESWASTLLNIQEKYPISLDLGDVLSEMLESISKIKNLLLNSKKTEFIVVTIPENLAVNETQDLLKSLNNLKTPTQYLIINKILPKNNCDFCKNKGFEQSQYIKKLQEFKLKSVGIELFNKEIKGLKSLKELENKLFSN